MDWLLKNLNSDSAETMRAKLALLERHAARLNGLDTPAGDEFTESERAAMAALNCSPEDFQRAKMGFAGPRRA